VAVKSTNNSNNSNNNNNNNAFRVNVNVGGLLQVLSVGFVFAELFNHNLNLCKIKLFANK
jgi:hypothetical protein